MAETFALPVPTSVTSDELEDFLVGQLSCQPGPQGRLERTYVDTFDWRFAGAGLVVEHERILAPAAGAAAPPPDSAFLRLRRRHEVPALAEAPLVVIPRLVRHVPDRTLRAALSVTARNRALLVVGRLGVEARIYRMLDEQSRAVVRLVVSDERPLLVAGHRAGDGLRRVLVSAVRGHDEDFARVRARLESFFASASASCGDRGPGGDGGPGGRSDLDVEPADLAARAAGYEPGVDPTSFAVALEADASADSAYRALLARYAQVLAANEPGVRDDLDPVFLADFHEALIRIRVLVGTGEDAIAEADRVWLADELTWLAALTGPLRDLDELAADLDVTPRDALWAHDLGFLREEVDRARGAARAPLTEALGSERYRAFMAQAQRVASSPRAGTPPALILAGRQIYATYAEVRNRGRSARAGADFHAVRLAARRLGHLVDAFGPLLAEPAVGEARRSLRRLQRDLGVFGEHSIAADLSASVAGAMYVGGGPGGTAPVGPGGLLAAGAYAQRRRDLAQRALRRARHRFGRFDAAENEATFRELWWESGAPGGPSPAAPSAAAPSAAGGRSAGDSEAPSLIDLDAPPPAGDRAGSADAREPDACEPDVRQPDAAGDVVVGADAGSEGAGGGTGRRSNGVVQSGPPAG